MRLDRPIGTWLLLLPAWWGILAASGGVAALGPKEIWTFFLFGIGAVLLRGAGCTVNDIWDRDIDRKVERTRLRPLAAGDVGVGQAIFFAACLLGLGFLILIQLPRPAIVIGLLSLGLVVLYPLAKRVTWYPQLVLGLTFNIGVLIGWAAVTGQPPALPAWILYLAGVFWTLGYDTIYAHQDKEDDARIGVRSTALRFGKKSPLCVMIFYAAFSALVYLAGFLGGKDAPFFFFWSLASLHLVWQTNRWDMDDPRNCLTLFRANRETGWLVLLSFAP